MNKLLKVAIIALALAFASVAAFGESPPVRIKDIAHVLQARKNQLMGFGLVVGLRHTGDSTQTGFTRQALTNLLSRMGVVPESVDFRSRNVAAVMVTADLPPFIKSGQELDVTVSSVGDASSLLGGTLLLTPLQGADEEIYAVAQGPMSIGGLHETTHTRTFEQFQTTVGRIPGGALVEMEVPVNLIEKNLITIVIDQPDFTTASRIVDVLVSAEIEARAADAATIQIPIYEGEDPISVISKIENLTVVPAAVAKVVINERTGTIVIGENVKLSPVAVTYQGIAVTVSDISIYSRDYGRPAEESVETETISRTGAKVREERGGLVALPPAATISDLVKALNTIGATSRDLISILQAMKEAGALAAEIEVI
ncbi:MAG: flagellar basal body P-ring protein FlgI [Candidatus Saganbacteria bacterium]|nr:flagellar basal body P-ring protein FlgI [Candidatus Saganbacteria bacterium]